MNIWIARILRSKTMNWGHIQVIGGTLATILVLVSPETLPGLPAWVYSGAAIVAGGITYVLRFMTKMPLDQK